MEKIFEISRRFRIVLFIITVCAFAINAYSFWPPDLVPHGPHVPTPDPVENPKDCPIGKNG